MASVDPSLVSIASIHASVDADFQQNMIATLTTLFSLRISTGCQWTIRRDGLLVEQHCKR